MGVIEHLSVFYFQNNLFLQIIKRTPDLLNALSRYMGVYLRRLTALVTKKLLNISEISTGFQQMRCVAVPQPVQSDRFADPCLLTPFL